MLELITNNMGVIIPIVISSILVTIVEFITDKNVDKNRYLYRDNKFIVKPNITILVVSVCLLVVIISMMIYAMAAKSFDQTSNLNIIFLNITLIIFLLLAVYLFLIYRKSRVYINEYEINKVSLLTQTSFLWIEVKYVKLSMLYFIIIVTESKKIKVHFNAKGVNILFQLIYLQLNQEQYKGLLKTKVLKKFFYQRINQYSVDVDYKTARTER